VRREFTESIIAALIMSEGGGGGESCKHPSGSNCRTVWKRLVREERERVLSCKQLLAGLK